MENFYGKLMGVNFLGKCSLLHRLFFNGCQPGTTLLKTENLVAQMRYTDSTLRTSGTALVYYYNHVISKKSLHKI